MMTFLLFAPASTKWLGWRKDRKFRRDRSGRFCDDLLCTLSRYVLSVTFCGAVVMKVKDQKRLVKRKWSYKVRITVYINTWRVNVGQTRVNKSLIGNLARHSFSLFDGISGIRLSPKQARRVNNGWLITSRTMADYRNSLTAKFDLSWLIPCSQMSFRYKVWNKTRMRGRELMKRP